MHFANRWSLLEIAFVLTVAQNVRATTTSIDVGSIILQGLGSFGTNTTSSSTSAALQSIPASITGIVGSTFISAVEPRPTDGFQWSANDGITDLPQAQQCFSDIVSWRVKSIAWYNANVANRTWPQTITTTTDTELFKSSTTIYPTNASIYTLCDHSPRVDVKPITEHSSWNTTLSFTRTRPATPTYSISQPCVPDNHMCRLWYYESDLLDSSEAELMSNCGLPAHMDPVHKPCLIGGGPVRLIYAPVTTQGGNLCAHNGTTVLTNANTTMAPITALGTTFDPGSVYVSFSTLYAYYDGFGTNETVGPTFTNHIVALTSAAISTHCGGWFAASGPGTALNYADLNWPVAASAYKCQARCNLPEQTTSCDLDGCHIGTVPHHPGCKTIWSDVDPILALPTDVSKMVPAWSTCSAWDETLPNFWFDPPIALQPVATIAHPTVPGGGEYTAPTTAAPAQTPTALPEITAAPTTWGNSPAESGQAGGGNGDTGDHDGDHTFAPQAGETANSGGSHGGGGHDSMAGVSSGPHSVDAQTNEPSDSQGSSDNAVTSNHTPASQGSSNNDRSTANDTPVSQGSSNNDRSGEQTSTAQAVTTAISSQDGTPSVSSQPSRAASAPTTSVFTGGSTKLAWTCTYLAAMIVSCSAFMLT